MIHELPGFIDDEEAALLISADDIPDMGEDDVHCDGT